MPVPDDVEPEDRDARDDDDRHQDKDKAMGSGHRRHSTQPGGHGPQRSGFLRFGKPAV